MNSFFGLQAAANTQWTTLAAVIGWILTIFIGLLGAWILFLIITGKIDLTQLISEPTGEASLSRLQFLIFTFAIALSLFLIIVSQTPPDFPKPFYPIPGGIPSDPIPGGILALLGISGGSYVVSKGISPKGAAPRDAKVQEASPDNVSVVDAGADNAATDDDRD